MKSFIVLLAFLSFNSWSDSSGLDSDFKTLLKRHGVGASSTQSYCYSQRNLVDGLNIDKVQEIASVTKLFTTFFASETLDLNQKFTTTIYISGDRLHIKGSRDPYFEEEKLLLLMSSLNELGYKSFKEVSFDKNFMFYDVGLGQYRNVTSDDTRVRLAAYFNSKNASFVKSKWKSTVKFAEEEGVRLDDRAIPSLSASSVIQSDTNPLIGTNPITYYHVSKPLHSLLKSMNVMSKNMVAQHVFDEASKIKPLSQLLLLAGLEANSYKIYNGSGLPIKSSSKRTDNLASCRSVLKVVMALEKSLLKHRLKISDVVAVSGGKDLGSFRERFLDFPETNEAVISKTGTLSISSTLAGFLLSSEKIPFAILNRTSSPSKARSFQDEFVSRMFHQLGEPVPMVYEKISIFPWSEADFLVRN